MNQRTKDQADLIRTRIDFALKIINEVARENEMTAVTVEFEVGDKDSSFGLKRCMFAPCSSAVERK